MRMSSFIVLGAILSTPGLGLAKAESAPPEVVQPDRLRLSLAWDSTVVAASSATMALSTLIPVDQSTRWHTQLLPLDSRLEGRYSATAADVSDVLLATDIALPAALMVRHGIDANMRAQVVVYCEALLVSLAIDSLVKPLVGRPRPYTYSYDAGLASEAQGRDSHLSFYSSHASTAFAASVSGALLFAQSTSDSNARAAVWGTELALAAATADLRTRAGMHFYSDVLVGALVGSAVGLAVPYFHGGRKVRLGKLEWLAIVLGPLVGVGVAESLPLGR
jgi:hypothetical protein